MLGVRSDSGEGVVENQVVEARSRCRGLNVIRPMPNAQCSMPMQRGGAARITKRTVQCKPVSDSEVCMRHEGRARITKGKSQQAHAQVPQLDGVFVVIFERRGSEVWVKKYD